MPVATTEKVAGAPTGTVRSAGGVSMAGGTATVETVSVATSLVSEPRELVATTV